MYNKFGMKDCGPQTAYNIVVGAQYDGVTEAMLKPPSEIAPAINNWFNTPHTMGEVLEMLALPGINVKAHKIMNGIDDFNTMKMIIEKVGVTYVLFDYGIKGKLNEEWWNSMKRIMNMGATWEQIETVLMNFATVPESPYHSYDEFYNAIRRYGLMFICSKQLGNTDGLERAETMYTYWDDIRTLFSLATFYPSHIETKKIIITGEILMVTTPDGKPYVDREDFIKYVNTISVQYGVLYKTSKAFNSSEFVIADSPSNTEKYREGMARGILITSDKFLQLIKQRLIDYKNSKNNSNI